MKKILRRFFERASRGRVLKRRFPARFGGMPIYVSPDSALKFWKPDLEATDQALMDWAERYVSAGNVVWDIGANVGLFAFCAAHKAGSSGHVIAVEPDVFLVELLRKTASANLGKCAKTVVLPIAVSDTFAVQEFAIAERGRSANFLTTYGGSTQTGGIRETMHVVTVTLDWLASQLPRPDVLKIDVECAECPVLRGAEALLQDKRPTVICEVSKGQSEEVTALLHSCRYNIFDLEQLEIGQVQNAPFNTLAIPEEKDIAA